MKKHSILLFILIFTQLAMAEFTIHILNPWANDPVADRRDSLRILGNAEVGFYPGILMNNEGNGWFYYFFKKTDKTAPTGFSLVTWIGSNRESYNQRQIYGKVLRIDSLFAMVADTVDEIWVELNSDLTIFPTVYSNPPKTVITTPYRSNRKNNKIYQNLSSNDNIKLNEHYSLNGQIVANKSRKIFALSTIISRKERKFE
jgi:hypothetical protein